MFERYSDPNRIYQSYKKLFAVLDKESPAELEGLYRKMTEKTNQAKAVLSGKTYISGNTALCNYELHSFLAERLDVKPQLLQIVDLDDDSIGFRENLLKYCDPYVTRSANLGAIGYLYSLLNPDFNIGAGNTVQLRKLGIASVRMMNAYNTLGFEVCGMVIDAFLQANLESKLMKDGISMEMKKTMRGGVGI